MCTYQGDRIDNDNIKKNTIPFLQYTEKYNNYAIIFVISFEI